MKFHKEGYPTLILILVLGSALILISKFFAPVWLYYLVTAICIFLLIIVIQFFRSPKRVIPKLDDNLIYAPADGKVVVIEESENHEFLKGKFTQVSIFMSPINVHVNRFPISGEVKYSKYHKGKYLVAWHPKSSSENERTTVVIENKYGTVLMRQIAGALARRIVNYSKAGAQAHQGEEMGFIKFGSRVDLFLPLDAKIEVQLDQKVTGNKTVIARFK